MKSNCHQAIDIIRDELKAYVIRHRIQALILGVSGGIDSALCAALAAPVCTDLMIPLAGRSITIETNRREETTRARMIGKSFCSDFREADLTDLYQDSLAGFEEAAPSDPESRADRIRRGNIKARLRMIYLYNLASHMGGMVLSTDNKTEELVGFWTLHGDVGDFGMIQNLWKTEVYAVAVALAADLQTENRNAAAALSACIDAVPTDGLGITTSDLEQLEVTSYREADRLLQEYLEEGNRHLESHPVIQRHLKTSYKRTNPFNITREKILNQRRQS